MNLLPYSKWKAVVDALTHGLSIRKVRALTGVSSATILTIKNHPEKRLSLVGKTNGPKPCARKQTDQIRQSCLTDKTAVATASMPVVTQWAFRACPRCSGTVVTQRGLGDEVETQCVNCGALTIHRVAAG